MLRVPLGVLSALTLGVFSALGGCSAGRSDPGDVTGSETGEGNIRGRAISFRMSVAGKTLLGFDGAGLHVAESVPSSAEIPVLSLDGYQLGARLPLLWLLVSDVRVAPVAPIYEPLSGFDCSVSAELAALSALVKNGGTRKIALPAIPAAAAAGACATKRVLRCYLSLWEAPGEGDGHTLAQAAQKALACAQPDPHNPLLPGNGKASFVLTGTSVLFSPSPIVTISIYEGRLTDYDEALVNRTPVATVSIPETCASATRACLNSPLPLDQCKKCNALKVGVTYTAFLSERTGQRHSDIKAVSFVR